MNAFMHTAFGITDFWTYVLGTIFIVLLPGPNSMYVLSVAAQRGVRAGYKGACGVFLGDAVLMVLSAAGVASLLKASPALFYVVKYVGAAYLAWIGFNMLRGALRSWAARGDATSAAVPSATPDQSDPFRKALLISLLNPKAILFFISFFIQFVDPAFAYPVLSFGVLGLVCQICSFAYLTTIIFVGAKLAEAFRRRRRLSAGMSSGVGAMFIGFGAKLATATMN
ncbi:leucine efflux protein LeuE [Cupriavidus taiwanensis]|uniref:Amino acid efflux protein, RhtB family n=1 Tax=Cupriavidus taiwanensis TaxID=164546 RepID=A0A375IAI8_9BURK|nr:leucine efflux protein LeuE [Cupriavidus taiwanensis]SOY43399.1 putative amino acid efflux protein, RhtB family [Cupriavidus taiwanensis]SOY45880.1 putative amino acid efflux protein, RhtB family [Cupriavidus taiwanensis]SOY81338.1 putative amino acid efflux protein, RhtB family [Cupriavidus taiwanensis]SOZ22581.1 putative amino acid efflux protein, RhtB family [Cupriavidus taiwanensis]SOZ54355.1 putative amino acid efflux protein, RhtB family [Cupriavidus taiwanensis]